MTPEQLSTMNTWLAVIAIASVIQVVALAVVALAGYRMYSRSRVAIDDVQRQIEPVTRRGHCGQDGVVDEGLAEPRLVVAQLGFRDGQVLPDTGAFRAVGTGQALHRVQDGPRPLVLP